jgi:hypothetical protein
MEGLKNAGGYPIDFIEQHKYPRIIAFHGKFGTGKDSSADVVAAFIHNSFLMWRENGFIEYLPGKIHELKFADALKQASTNMTGTALADQYSATGKATVIPDLKMTIATFQQVLGTVAREHIHPDIWIIPVINQCRQAKEDFCIISDCRFPNELKTLHEIGAVVIRLRRNYDLISEESKAGRDPTHISETALDHLPDSAFDFVIDNHGHDNEHLRQALGFLRSLWNTGSPQ